MLTPHADVHGHMQMDDLTGRPSGPRTAVAVGKVEVSPEVFALIQEHRLPKGDALTVAQLAGIMAAKKASELIPLARPVPLEGIDVELSLNEEERAIFIRAYIKTVGLVGVEMEALTAVALAALTIYDMCKSVSKDIRITDIHLVAKTGGQSGDYLKVEQEQA